jgi:hypothetical protein
LASYLVEREARAVKRVKIEALPVWRGKALRSGHYITVALDFTLS